MRKAAIPYLSTDEAYPEHGGLYVHYEKEKKDGNKKGFEVL